MERGDFSNGLINNFLVQLPTQGLEMKYRHKATQELFRATEYRHGFFGNIVRLCFRGRRGKADALKSELHQCQLDSAHELAEVEHASHEADKAAAAELRKAEQEIGKLREELAKIRSK